MAWVWGECRTLEFVRSEIAEHAVATGWIVEVLDVIRDSDGELEDGPPSLPVQQLDLHRAPKRFHGGIIEAVPDGAHGAHEAETPDVFGKGPGSELAPVVRGMTVEGDVGLEVPALARASLTNTASQRRSIAQPTTFLQYMSTATQQ